MVTASHNPPNYNGMKFVREESRPISADTGLQDIRALAERDEFGPPVAARGKVEQVDVKPDYIEHLLSYVDSKALAPLKIVVNAGNGGAGPDRRSARAAPAVPLRQGLPRARRQLPERRAEPDDRGEPRRRRSSALRAERADLGIAWDGDYDRCFFFDEHGQFIEGYYIVGLARADVPRASRRGERIVHDPRLTWNTLDIVNARRRQGRAEQVRARVHQAAHARGRCRLRRRDERAPLLPRVLVRRQRHDPVAAGRARS